jgi:hypothetical protein
MFEAHEGKAFSQQGEDGIIQHIFNVIGTTNKIAAEIGVWANFPECNTMYLALTGWKTFWFDMNYVDSSKFNLVDNTFVLQKLTADNVAEEFKKVSVPFEIDLLSIDIDGNDYHLREALSEYRPRVCIQEYNGCFDATTQHIMPRNDNYVLCDRSFGASLKSMELQAERQGYDLVYCGEGGVNAFFIRKDVNPFGNISSEKAWKKLFWADGDWLR